MAVAFVGDVAQAVQIAEMERLDAEVSAPSYDVYAAAFAEIGVDVRALTKKGLGHARRAAAARASYLDATTRYADESDDVRKASAAIARWIEYAALGASNGIHREIPNAKRLYRYCQPASDPGSQMGGVDALRQILLAIERMSPDELLAYGYKPDFGASGRTLLSSMTKEQEEAFAVVTDQALFQDQLHEALGETRKVLEAFLAFRLQAIAATNVKIPPAPFALARAAAAGSGTPDAEPGL